MSRDSVLTNKSSYVVDPYFEIRYIINGEYDLGRMFRSMGFSDGFAGIEPLDDDDCFYYEIINKNLVKAAKYAYIELTLDNNAYIVKDKIHK